MPAVNRYDYDDIVVGAGGSGLPLAARLSEDPARKVALVEAGPDYPPGETPADILNGNTMSLALHNWKYEAGVVPGRRAHFPQGRVSGGSTAVGNTVAIRALPGDMDEWAAAGNPAWSWERTLPYFRALEHDLDFGDAPYHGAQGPVPIRRVRPDEVVTVQQLFFEACIEAGYPLCEDHNDPESTGVGPMPSNRRDFGTRVSTTAYLSTARGRENFTVIPDTVVNRVLFDDGRACGVELATGTTVQELRARRVILAAGAINSPAILMRSGIGPAEDLRRLGIEVRADLPAVGRNLVDQQRVGVFWTPRPGAENFDLPTAQIVMRTTSETGGEFNDLYYAMVSSYDLRMQFPGLLPHAEGPRAFCVMAVVRRPESRGQVTLVSADPRQAPAIDLNFLDSEHDYQLLAEGVRNCWAIGQAPKIAGRGKAVVMLDEAMLDDDERMREYVRISVESAYNPVGTVRMGPAGDESTAVDEHGAVHGVEGLHVADASIFPFMVRANIKLTSIMIGERMAALLRGE